MKSRTRLKFGQIRLMAADLAAFERLEKKSHRLIMGKRCDHSSALIFD